MASNAYNRFIESMKGSFDQWHDGTGYDLEALRQSTVEERVQAEAVLIEHLNYPGDWRDVEALTVIGTPTAKAVIESAVEHRVVEVRKYARELLAPPPPPPTPAEEEDATIRCIEMGAIYDARSLPTPRVKRALLDRARHVNPQARVLAATLLMELCGHASDDNLLQRIKSEDSKVMRAAWSELRTLTGV